MGPVAANDDDEEGDGTQGEADEWNFSTSDNFNERFSRRYSQMIGAHDFAEPHFEAPAGSGLPPIVTKGLTPLERFRQQHEEMSANRGERSLDRLFNPETAPYELHTPVDDPEHTSDLPLRNMTAAGPTRESLIDLDSAAGMDMHVPTFNFDFGDVPTMKARTSRTGIGEEGEEEEDPDFEHYGPNDKDERRATMDWKFPTVEKKRATMDWTFSSAQAAEPEEPDTIMNLPPAGSEGFPPGFRPQLKHTATEPLGNFKDFMHPPQTSMPVASSPVRQSVTSMIDLDMGLADPAEIVRPSTATSATGSTATDMTSGNPFDLEDDSEQNEQDRNRFSYHKQWQSEGGQSKRLSHKTMAMHSRGSSLTSTSDAEFERRPSQPTQPARSGPPAPPAAPGDVFDYDYSRQLAETMRSQMGLGLPEHDIGHWPNFGPDSGLDESPQYPDTYVPSLASPKYPLQQPSRPNSVGQRSVSQPRHPSRAYVARREIEFVNPVAPHRSALLEDADPQLVASELDRLLDDFGQSLEATSKALKQHTGVVREGESSEAESGFESSAVTTGDEDGF